MANLANGELWELSLVVFLIAVRDLDSELSPREVSAVSDFLRDSSKNFHVMRDHPQHDVPMLGGTWAVKLTRDEIRSKMQKAVKKMFKSRLIHAPRDQGGPDQKLLARYVWWVGLFFLEKRLKKGMTASNVCLSWQIIGKCDKKLENCS